jgi:hypothetical protein
MDQPIGHVVERASQVSNFIRAGRTSRAVRSPAPNRRVSDVNSSTGRTMRVARAEATVIERMPATRTTTTTAVVTDRVNSA